MITSAKAQDLFYVGDVARQLPTLLVLISNDFEGFRERFRSISIDFERFRTISMRLNPLALVTFNRLRVRRDGKIEELEASGQSSPGSCCTRTSFVAFICLINFNYTCFLHLFAIV